MLSVSFDLVDGILSYSDQYFVIRAITYGRKGLLGLLLLLMIVETITKTPSLVGRMKID